jgi:hypothetical protein
VDVRPLEKAALLRPRVELARADEVVVLARLLALARRARGGGDDALELLPREQLLADGRLPGARGTGDDDEAGSHAMRACEQIPAGFGRLRSRPASARRLAGFLRQPGSAPRLAGAAMRPLRGRMRRRPFGIGFSLGLGPTPGFLHKL